MRQEDSLGSKPQEAVQGLSKGSALHLTSFRPSMASLPVRLTSSLILALTHPLECQLPKGSWQAPLLQLNSPPPPRSVWPCTQLPPLRTSLALQGLRIQASLTRATHCSPLHPASLVHASHSSAPPSRHSNAPSSSFQLRPSQD